MGKRRRFLGFRAALALAFALGLGCETPVKDSAAPTPLSTPPPSSQASQAPSAPPAAPSASAALPPSSASLPLRPVPPRPPPPDPPIVLKAGGKHSVRGEAGLVTSVEANATRAGTKILKRGGNAIDAAVAVAFALAVTHPSAGNIGGGGFMIVRLANGQSHALDFREIAPAAATAEKNDEQLKAGAHGYLSAAVPGTVAGMALIHEQFGSRPWAELIEPAIVLARKGHKLTSRAAMSLNWHWKSIRQDPAALAVFGQKSKKPKAEGEILKQPDLAKTLEAIAKEGRKAFYEGDFAQQTDKAMRENKGLVTADDLRKYKAVLRKPLHFSYRGFEIDTMPPPSMGGIAFAQIMLWLERLRAYEQSEGSGSSLHLFAEASRRAYAKRRLVGGDPDTLGPENQAFLKQLLDGDALLRMTPEVDPEHTTPSSEIEPAPGTPGTESPETTHFSIVDAEGNAVSCTYTQSAAFGARIVIPNTGVLLSNAMGAFSRAGVNTLAPGKRMSSSMTPTIVTQNNKLVLVLGSPGGDTIPSTVAQVFRNLIDYKMPIDEAIEKGRVLHIWMPDRIRAEKRKPPSKQAMAELEKKGHTIELSNIPLGDAKGILIDEQGIAWGHADSREGGLAEGILRAPQKKK